VMVVNVNTEVALRRFGERGTLQVTVLRRKRFEGRCPDRREIRVGCRLRKKRDGRVGGATERTCVWCLIGPVF